MSRNRSSFGDMIFRKKDRSNHKDEDGNESVKSSSQSLPVNVSQQSFASKNNKTPINDDALATKKTVENIGNDNEEFKSLVASLKVSVGDQITVGDPKHPSPTEFISSNIVPPKPPTPRAVLGTITMQGISKAFPQGSLSEKNLALKVSNDMDLCKVMFSEDRVGEAAGLLASIMDFVDILTSEGLKNYLLSILDEKIFQDIRAAAEHLTKTLEEFCETELWTEWNSSVGPHQDVTIFTHKTDKQHDYSIKLEGNIHCRLKEVAAALLETQFYHLWMPMCTNCKVLTSISAMRKIVRIDLDFVLLKKTAVLEVKTDILPDGQILVTFASLPFTDNVKFYNRDRKAYMVLSGGFLIGRAIIEVDQHSIFDKIVVQSKNIKDKPVQCNPSQHLGKTPTTADVYNVHIDDIYAIGETSKMACNPLKGSDSIDSSEQNNELHGGISSANSWYDSNPKTVKKEVVSIRAVFKANLMTEIVPDWIFNLAVRSAISMFIPMLEHQASLFQPGEYHFDCIKNNSIFYDEINRRINSSSLSND